ncbi:2OG-Fe(II) oxygenase [Flavobacterium cerinum]|uniref:2OG-Fe(II) oxygenase n=1 Tax=Flavobacterium cerinum TaxID=2502784 RepID=A0ABY5IR24_9FLAO|nr:2OG-Fe(II) oxygenase [Flavobacterium cerinum]UUC45297.1 2OG-Fe(II) oxygenase [Flavobacterium cerinum]
METVSERLKTIDWDQVAGTMHEKGYVVLSDIVPETICNTLIDQYNESGLYRKTVVMERYRFGKGEYKYFDYPLPDLIQQLRSEVYEKLVPIANLWMKALHIDTRYPEKHQELLELCKDNNQLKPTALILNYTKGGFNTLHQDLYGEVYFPIQMVLFLNETGEAYTGGEFVLTEQVPRAQSKAIVLQPKRGDILIFTTNFRPVRGTKGYYRVGMKHGVSEVRSGNRYTMGIIFHDAIS